MTVYDSKVLSLDWTGSDERVETDADGQQRRRHRRPAEPGPGRRLPAPSGLDGAGARHRRLGLVPRQRAVRAGRLLRRPALRAHHGRPARPHALAGTGAGRLPPPVPGAAVALLLRPPPAPHPQKSVRPSAMLSARRLSVPFFLWWPPLITSPIAIEGLPFVGFSLFTVFFSCLFLSIRRHFSAVLHVKEDTARGSFHCFGPYRVIIEL